jgi:hypothetical protein
VLVSGHRSRRIFEPLAAVIASEIVEEHPELIAYPFAVGRFARAEARSALIAKALAEQGIFDEDGQVRDSLIRTARTLDRDAAQFGERLGLDPVAATDLAVKRAAARKLTSSTAMDLQTLEARGRALIEADGRHDVAGEIIAELKATTPPGPRKDPDRPPRKKGQGSRALKAAKLAEQELARREAEELAQSQPEPWGVRPVPSTITPEDTLIALRDARVQTRISDDAWDQAEMRAAMEAEEEREADDDVADDRERENESESGDD